MANAAERVFEEVLNGLSDDSLWIKPDWPDTPFDDEESELPEYDDDWIYPYREERGERVPDDGRFGDADPDNGGMVEGGLRNRGVEALAFYKSKRYQNLKPFRGRWGVFYLEQGLDYIAHLIAASYPGFSSPRKLARDFLYAHEHYHFRADLQTLMMEALTNRHIYIPLRRALRGRRTLFVEEALANREAFHWARQSRIGMREFAAGFMNIQPNAYSRYDEPHAVLAGEWLSNTLELKPPGCAPRSDINAWVMATPRDLMRNSLCPEYVVRPANLNTWLDPAHIPPPVSRVEDNSSLLKTLASRYPSLKEKWERTKAKLVENHLRHGLNFKPWPRDGRDAYSVRVDRAVRAHLRHQGGGIWEAYDIGPHGKMGHG